MCGILGIVGRFTTKSMLERLKLLQHRGSESYGYHCDNSSIQLFQGKIGGSFPDSTVCQRGIAHTRYSTSGSKDGAIDLSQPFRSELGFTLVHNGNIPNHSEVARHHRLALTTESDTEVLVRYIEFHIGSGLTMRKTLTRLIHDIRGAYCLLINTEEGLYAVRDRFGVRPLYIGRSDSGFYYGSETVALAECYPLGEVMRGSVVFCDGKEQKVLYKLCGAGPARVCTFEEVYFKHHRNYNTYNHRFQMGYELGLLEHEPRMDAYVVCMPNTAIPFAEGFETATGIPFMKDWIVKSSADRTFIQPTDVLRISACNKSYIVSDQLYGKVIYLIDDSLVRGHTMNAIISSLRKIGVKEIHVRIGSPPVVESCQYGIDIPSRNQLIAHGRTVEEIRSVIGADSLQYLPRNKLEDVCVRGCTQCFGGDMLW